VAALTKDPVAKRPLLHTSYRSEMAMFNTRAKRNAVIVLVFLAMTMPLWIADDWLTILARGSAYAIGAIGLMLLTGYAGQISLGHAFFAAIGFYTAAVLGGDPDDPRRWGFGITEIAIWLPAAGLVAAALGVLVAPLATRLRGLYLAIVTLGLVFVGEHFFEHWTRLSGGSGSGRAPAPATLFGYRLDRDSDMVIGVGAWEMGPFTRQQQLFWLMLVMLVLFAVAARNLARSDVGRAFTAIRDRDIAAAVIGVNLFKQKTVAFAISSFYAGCFGALFYLTFLNVNPLQFNLLLSVLFLIMVLVGGVGTISGAIAGAFLIAVLPRFTQWLASEIPFISSDPQGIPNYDHLRFVLYGLLIILFLMFEPRGLFGIWFRIRNWFRSYPFSY
jgi:branched-chain amino acid transport system permease protein